MPSGKAAPRGVWEEVDTGDILDIYLDRDAMGEHQRKRLSSKNGVDVGRTYMIQFRAR